MKKLKLFLPILSLFVASQAMGQTVLFSDDFSKPAKWSFYTADKGTKSYEKEGDVTFLSLQSVGGNEFVATMKLPKPSPAAKGFKITYQFKTNELGRSPVAFGTTPNRLRIHFEPGGGKIRVSGEDFTISNGAKFLAPVALGEWHTMEINYVAASKIATFRIDDGAAQMVDLNRQAESQTFTPDRITLTSGKDGVKVMYKYISIEEIQ